MKDRSVIAMEEFVGFGKAPEPEGLGVLGPLGANPNQIVADQYEISGTGVNFRATPGGASMGTFNPDTSLGDTVVGTPEQFASDGTVATANGLTWAHGVAATGSMQGKDGWVAAEYLAPVGWTAQQGKVSATGGGGGGVQPASITTSSTTTTITNWLTDWKTWVIGGAILLGVILVGAAMKRGKKGKRGRVNRSRRYGKRSAARRRSRRRSRRRR